VPDQSAPAIAHYPVLGAAAVLVGAFVVNFDTRLFSIGLPCLRAPSA
jgi:DHA2 family multidrug resistance protein